jgi:import receptor subunit TOM22
MFPDSLVNGTKNLASWSTSAVKKLYGLSRSAAWITFSSSLILFAPLVFEIERVRVQESQKQHQRQVSYVTFLSFSFFCTTVTARKRKS